MGNPHAQETELAYLAGIIDGEGTVTLEWSGRRAKRSLMPGLRPTVHITNTDEILIQHCLNVLKKFNIKPQIRSQPVGYKSRKKRCYWLKIQGLSRVKKLLEPIKPFLIVKSAQAALLLEFINHRGDPRLAKGKKYGQVEKGILDKIRALNLRGASETEDRSIHRFDV